MKEFYTKIYNRLREVPSGKVTTYKELAHSVGSRAYRAVGTAMKNNRDIKNIHCYKVVLSNGYVGQYSNGGTRAKIKKLGKEGILTKGKRIIDFEKYLHKYKKD